MTPIEFSSHGLFVGFEHIECLRHEVVAEPQWSAAICASMRFCICGLSCNAMS